METLTQYIAMVPPEVWGAIVTGTGVSAAVMPLKKWIGQRPKVSLFVTIALSFATAFIPWLIQTGTSNPALLGPATVQTVFWATIAYRYVIQPFSRFWHDYKQFKQEKREDVDKTTVTVLEDEPAPADPLLIEQNKTSSEFSF